MNYSYKYIIVINIYKFELERTIALEQKFSQSQTFAPEQKELAFKK